jgi:hypothetical protein
MFSSFHFSCLPLPPPSHPITGPFSNLQSLNAWPPFPLFLPLSLDPFLFSVIDSFSFYCQGYIRISVRKSCFLFFPPFQVEKFIFSLRNTSVFTPRALFAFIYAPFSLSSYFFPIIFFSLLCAPFSYFPNKEHSDLFFSIHSTFLHVYCILSKKGILQITITVQYKTMMTTFKHISEQR